VLGRLCLLDHNSQGKAECPDTPSLAIKRIISNDRNRLVVEVTRTRHILTMEVNSLGEVVEAEPLPMTRRQN